jgi:hypothetical protein
MCSQPEWDRLRRRFEDAIESEDLRYLISEAAAHLEDLIEEIKVWGCSAENPEWARRRQRRSRPEWVV